MTLYQPEPVEMSTRIRPGEWSDDTLAEVVANFREELLQMGARSEAITVAIERDDHGGVSVVATWSRQPGRETDFLPDPGAAAGNPTPGSDTNPAVGTQNPPNGIQGNTNMMNRDDIDGLIQSKGNVISVDGETIGAMGQIYVDDAMDRPSWATVTTGLFGSHESFFPLEGARIDGSNLVIPYSKALVKDAPRVEPEGELEPDEQDRLYRHYQRDGGLQTYSESRGMPGAGGGDVPTAGTNNQENAPVALRRYVPPATLPPDVPITRDGQDRGHQENKSVGRSEAEPSDQTNGLVDTQGDSAGPVSSETLSAADRKGDAGPGAGFVPSSEGSLRQP